MTLFKWHPRCVPVALALLLTAGLVSDDKPTGQATSSEILGGPQRFLTHISTDKPIYRIGERVYVRGVLLHANTHVPIADDTPVFGLVDITGPKGEHVAGGYAALQDSVLGFVWDVPEGQAGGTYAVRISYPQHGHSPAEREFDIRAYRAPRLKSQIVFLRDGYGPGDSVGATMSVERAEGGVPAGAKVTAIGRVDGREVFRGVTKLDDRGYCTVHFKLPAEIARGEGTLALVIEDGGISETATKTIPILLQTVDLAIYPEGGDLIAGLPTRVYLEARTPAREPADLAGNIFNERGVVVASFRTEHEGRGRFYFTPQHGESYTLKISEPSGIRTSFPLPPVRETGAVIRSVEARTPPGQPILLKVGGTAVGPLTVTLTKRETEVASAKITPPPGTLVEVTLAPPPNVDGVLIATVWDETGQPLAERLVYRRPTTNLHISISADRKDYVPGGSAELTITTLDENGEPVSAVVGVTVSDDAVLEMIEKRRQAPRLTVMVLLEPEVRELADAHVYLDESDPNAPQALDLLLGTQGWRRFAFHEAQAFVREHGDAARRVLALRVAQQWRRAGHGGWAGIEKGLGRVVDAAAPAPDEPVNKPNQIKFGVEVRKPRDEAGQKDAARRDRELDRRLGPDRDKQEAFAALRQRGGFANQRQIGRGMFAQDEISVLADLVAVRVYAHSARPARQPGDRIDFAETLFWNTGVRTDAKTGQVKVRFDLSDSVTAFRVFADGFDAAGRLGQATTAIESVEPFYIEPKLPLEVTAGDLVLLPVGIVSHLDGGSHQATLTVETDSAINVGLIEPFLLSTTERQRRLIPLKIGSFNGATKLVVRADVQQIHDQVTRPLIVKPLGFPVEVAFGGLTVPDGSVTHKINIPADVVPGSITTDIAVYPTPLANLTQALERLIREPSGCFEQTCSTSYPLTMAQQYFLTHAGVDPDLIERSRRSLDKGYARLISFECKQRGYEWFGGDPGHEALTAFGLLHFADMAKVRTVDSAMLERTRRWLLNTRDGQGGFARKRRALHSWIEDQDCSNAYILWALLESGEKDLAPEIASLKNAATKSPNSYVLALAANAMALAGDTDAAIRLMQRLAKKQTQDGWVAGATSSIVGSGGSALKIETTALAVLAWLRDPAFAGPVENGVRFLADSCKAGRYGSTQSTVLALRAIIAYDKLRSRPKTAGSVTIYVDGQSVGGPVQFDEHTQGAIKLPDISELLTPGQHALEVRMHGGSAMPLSLAVNYYDRLPPSSEECKLDLSVSLRETKVTEGELTEADVIVRNRSDEPIPTPIAIIGLPGGLEPRHDQLKELVKAGRVDAYEVRGREIVLYWRSMKPGQEARISLSLIAAIPGTYTAPASRAYLYYTDEFKRWADPLKVSIPPRGGK